MVIPSRPGLDPSRSPAQPPDMVETLRVVGQGSGMEQVDNQDGWYYMRSLSEYRCYCGAVSPDVNAAFLFEHSRLRQRRTATT